jgi:hypothetical protein
MESTDPMLIALKSTWDAFAKRVAEVEQKEQEIRSHDRIVEINLAKANKRIILNVGGKIFETVKSTLLSVEGTYFYAMLASEKWKPDKDGIFQTIQADE